MLQIGWMENAFDICGKTSICAKIIIKKPYVEIRSVLLCNMILKHKFSTIAYMEIIVCMDMD